MIDRILPGKLLPEDQERFERWEQGLKTFEMKVVWLDTHWSVFGLNGQKVMTITYDINAPKNERFTLASGNES